MITVSIVDEVIIVCQVMAAALEEEPDIVVGGYTASLTEAISLSKNSDLVLVSATLPDNGAFRLTQTLAQSNVSVKVVITGMPNSSEAILSYIESGAAGYVLREETVNKLLKTIRAAYSNKAHVSSRMAATLMAHVAELSKLCEDNNITLDRSARLSAREQEILALIKQNLNNRQIAERLSLKLGTVKNHIHNILKKLNVDNRRAAMLYGREC